MKSTRVAGGIAFCALLTACVSASTGTKFDAGGRQAMLVEAVSLDRSLNIDVFRPVNLSTGRFTGPPISMTVDAFAGIETLLFEVPHNQINADVDGRKVALGIRTLPPGDYAWVETDRSIGSQNYGAGGGLCLARAAPVFSIAAGEIAIIRVDEMAMRQETKGPEAILRFRRSSVADEEVLKEFEQARGKYPGIVGKASVKDPVAVIRWPEKKADFLSSFFSSRNCDEPATFERLDRPRPGQNTGQQRARTDGPTG